MENYTGNVKITNIYKYRFKSPWLYALTRRGEINTMAASRSISLRNVVTRFPVDNISMSILNDKTK